MKNKAYCIIIKKETYEHRKKVWFITGGNKGIGAAIVKEALAEEYQVIATTRNMEEAEKSLGKHQNLLIVKMDVTNDEQVKEAV